MKTILFFLVLFFCGMAYAESEKNEWRWYYTAFASPDKSADVFIRSGFASVKLANNKIEIKLRDKNVVELAPIFIGNTSKGEVSGILKNFFMYKENIKLFGKLKFRKFAKDCIFEEVVLQPKEPTGSVLILSRVTGNCQ